MDRLPDPLPLPPLPVRCYLACGFRSEGVRREAELYPHGWQDLIVMGLLRSEYVAG
jgi:RimJ/RimL family protein N-acetyltransferase